MALAGKRPELWGEVVARHIGHRRLNRLVIALQGQYGPLLGSRNTFAKLFALEHPPAQDSLDETRAALLLMVAGLDPREFGVEGALPPGLVPPRPLHDEVKPRAKVRAKGRLLNSHAQPLAA